MSDAVFDSSLLLAIVKDEAYEETALDLLLTAVVSTVDLAEVLSKVDEMEFKHRRSLDGLLSSQLRIEPFTDKQANLTGALRAPTKHAGLSLGDRACLALALDLDLPVYTLDRNWLRVDVGCKIHCLR